MTGKVQATKAKLIAMRYGNPARGLAVVLVAGANGKSTTLRLLEGILRESGKTVASLANDSDSDNDSSLSAFYAKLAAIKKTKPNLVLIETTDALHAMGVLEDLTVDSLVVVTQNETSDKLLSLSPKHVIAPSSFSVPAGSVEPYQQISFGEDELADAKIDSIKLYKKGTELHLTIDHQTKLEIATHYAGLASAYCLTAAVAAAYVSGVDHEALQEGVADVEPGKQTLTWHQVSEPYEVVTDKASDQAAIMLAIDSVKQLTKRRLIVALAASEPKTKLLSDLKDRVDRLFVATDMTGMPAIDGTVSDQESYEKALRSAKKDDTVLLLGEVFLEMVGSDRRASEVSESAK